MSIDQRDKHSASPDARSGPRSRLRGFSAVIAALIATAKSAWAAVFLIPAVWWLAVAALTAAGVYVATQTGGTSPEECVRSVECWDRLERSAKQQTGQAQQISFAAWSTMSSVLLAIDEETDDEMAGPGSDAEWEEPGILMLVPGPYTGTPNAPWVELGIVVAASGPGAPTETTVEKPCRPLQPPMTSLPLSDPMTLWVLDEKNPAIDTIIIKQVDNAPPDEKRKMKWNEDARPAGVSIESIEGRAFLGMSLVKLTRKLKPSELANLINVMFRGDSRNWNKKESQELACKYKFIDPNFPQKPQERIRPNDTAMTDWVTRPTQSMLHLTPIGEDGKPLYDWTPLQLPYLTDLSYVSATDPWLEYAINLNDNKTKALYRIPRKGTPNFMDAWEKHFPPNQLKKNIDRPIKVAVIDTGFVAGFEDELEFEGGFNFARGSQEFIPRNPESPYANNVGPNFKIDPLSVYFKNGDRDPQNHGTIVAGIIGSKTNNNKGAAGAVGSGMTSMKVLLYALNASGEALEKYSQVHLDQWSIMQAIFYASGGAVEVQARGRSWLSSICCTSYIALDGLQDIDIINLSTGSFMPPTANLVGLECGGPSFREAIEDRPRKIPIVVSAGNSKNEVNTMAIRCPSVISVGGHDLGRKKDGAFGEIDFHDQSSVFPQGAANVILAPFVTIGVKADRMRFGENAGQYAPIPVEIAGTSVAAPQVTAAAAMLLTKRQIPRGSFLSSEELMKDFRAGAKYFVQDFPVLDALGALDKSPMVLINVQPLPMQGKPLMSPTSRETLQNPATR